MTIELSVETLRGVAKSMGSRLTVEQLLEMAREAPARSPISDLDALKENARRKTAAREASGIDPWIECRASLSGERIFDVDALEYQKKMRDEWV